METWGYITGIVAAVLLAVIGWVKYLGAGKREKTERRGRVHAELKKQSAERELRTIEAEGIGAKRQAELIAALNERIRNDDRPADLDELVAQLNAILDAKAPR